MANELNFADAQMLFHKYDIYLTESQYNHLAQFAELMVKESETQNITAVRTIPEIWTRHFLDSAFLCKYLPKTAFSVIDIGTGGGIPGIPIAILLNHAHVTLLDSEHSKIAFCQSVVNKLGLSVHCVSERAEELAKLSSYREQFDCAVSRAMTIGSILSEMALPFLKTNGTLYAMKGRNYDPEVERFESACEILHGKMDSLIQYQIEDEPKNLISIQKLEETPAQYPRRFAKMKRNPL